MNRLRFALPAAALLVLITSSLRAALGDDKTVGKLVPQEYRQAVVRQISAARANRGQLIEAIEAAPEAQRKGLAFLIANMPQHDLETLSKDFLLANVEYAYRARAEVPWGKEIPEEIFLNDVLPYASINERRDDWRKDFYNRFMPTVKKCKTPGEAALVLNQEAFRQLNVRYHATKRPKPDQSPYESAAAHYASCTGLSVIAVDACRAVGVPARFAGVAQWTGSQGNHSWTEVWDGSWRLIGSAESTSLDGTWFGGKAAQADAADPLTRVYAVSFARTGTWFPLVWDMSNHTVPAIDVTALYKSRRTVSVRLVDAHGKPAAAGVTFRYGGQIVAAGSGQSSYEFTVAGGLTYDAEIRSGDGALHAEKVSVPKEGAAPVTISGVR